MTERLPDNIMNDLTNLAASRAMEDVFATYQLIDDAQQRNQLIQSILLCFFGIAIRSTQIQMKAEKATAELQTDDDVVAVAIAEHLVDLCKRHPLPPAGVWAKP